MTLPLVALGSLAGCGDSPEVLFEKAKASFAAEDYNSARLQVATALKEQPDNKAMLELLVESQLRMGDPDGAEGAIGRLERAGGGGPALGLMKAEVALLRGKAAQAIALAAGNPDPEAWLVRAQAHLALGENAKAVEAFKQGLDTGGGLRLAEAYARYLLQNNDVAGTRSVYQRMVKLDPKAYETMVLAGDIAAAQGQTEQAIKAFTAVSATYPERVAPLLALANQYDALGKVDEAIATVKKAETIAPDAAAVQDLKIQLWAEKGEWTKIRDALQGREQDLVPGSGLQMKYAEALLRLGHGEQARMLFNRAVLALPGNPYARMMLGEAQLETGDNAGAWQTLKPLAMGTLARPEVLESAAKAAKAVRAPEASALGARLQPDRLKASMALIENGQGAVVRQDWPTVLDVYGKLAQQGDDAEVFKYLALANSRLGHAPEAMRYADRALALAPNNPDYLYLAGLVRLDAGTDLAGARRNLEAASAIDPDNPMISRALEKAKAAAG